MADTQTNELQMARAFRGTHLPAMAEDRKEQPAAPDAVTNDQNEAERQRALFQERERDREKTPPQGADQSTVQAAEQVVKKASNLWSLISSIEITSFWMIPVAVLQMNYQLIFGNLLNGSLLPAPKLPGWRIALLGVLDAFAFMLFVAVFLVIYYIFNSCELLKDLNPDSSWYSFLSDACKTVTGQ